MGIAEGPKGPKFCLIGILIIRQDMQHSQYRCTVFQKEALHMVSSDMVHVTQHWAIQDTVDLLPVLLQPGHN